MSTTRNVIIIGSGPAGHTAAIYAARANLEPLMFEGFMAGGIAAGGQLTTTTEVENYPGFPTGIQGPELMKMMREQSLHNGTEIITKTVDKVDLSVQPYKVYVGKDTYETKTIIIATGATAKKLPITGLDDYWMRGISGCAVCDGALPFFRDKRLAVVGGGDVAMEEALYLTKFASEVVVLVRKGQDDLKASKAMQERALNHEKIKFMFYTEVQEAHGDDMLTHLSIVNNQTQEVRALEVWWLFFAIGHTPNTKFLDGQIQLDETGYILTKPGTTRVVDPAQYAGKVSCGVATIPGVYAAGDVQDHVYRQAITSAWTWCMAALEAEKYITGGMSEHY